MPHPKAFLPPMSDGWSITIPHQNTIYLDRLPRAITDSKQLYEFGSKFGKVKKARVMLRKGESCSNGILTYTNEEEVAFALGQLRDHHLSNARKATIESIPEVLYHYVYPDGDNESLQSRGSRTIKFVSTHPTFPPAPAIPTSNIPKASTAALTDNLIRDEKAKVSAPEATVADDVALRTGILSSLVKLVIGIQQLLPPQDQLCRPASASLLFTNMERIMSNGLLSPSAASADCNDNYGVALTSSLRSIQGMKLIETRRLKNEYNKSDSLTLSRMRLTLKLVHDSVEREARKHGVEMV